MEGYSAVVDPALQQGSGMQKKGQGVSLVKDGEGPVTVDVRAKKDDPVDVCQKGESGGEQKILRLKGLREGEHGGTLGLPE
jgi:hypothetical protein